MNQNWYKLTYLGLLSSSSLEKPCIVGWSNAQQQHEHPKKGQSCGHHLRNTCNPLSKFTTFQLRLSWRTKQLWKWVTVRLRIVSYFSLVDNLSAIDDICGLNPSQGNEIPDASNKHQPQRKEFCPCFIFNLHWVELQTHWKLFYSVFRIWLCNICTPKAHVW